MEHASKVRLPGSSLASGARGLGWGDKSVTYSILTGGPGGPLGPIAPSFPVKPYCKNEINYRLVK